MSSTALGLQSIQTSLQFLQHNQRSIKYSVYTVVAFLALRRIVKTLSASKKSQTKSLLRNSDKVEVIL